jgi:hypothetical protein
VATISFLAHQFGFAKNAMPNTSGILGGAGHWAVTVQAKHASSRCSKPVHTGAKRRRESHICQRPLGKAIKGTFLPRYRSRAMGPFLIAYVVATAGGNEWKSIMEGHTYEEKQRQRLVHDARDKALEKATVEGRVYVVTANATRVKSAEQARTLGKSLLPWCAQRTTVEKVLPEDMVAPEMRTVEKSSRKSWKAGWSTEN